MRVVVDTNVLVAGLLSPFGRPGEMVRMIAVGSLSLLYDARIMAEYIQVLKRPKFSFSSEHIEALLDQVKAGGVIVAALPCPFDCGTRRMKRSSKSLWPSMPNVSLPAT